jgi:hypothetical protein
MSLASAIFDFVKAFCNLVYQSVCYSMIIKSGTLFTNLEKKEEKDIEAGKTAAEVCI